MFTPHSLEIALLMMITSAICWGSWANTYKGVKNYRFELFYWDYAIGIFLMSLILAFTMGSTSASDPAQLSEQCSLRRHLEHRLYADRRRHLQSGQPAAGRRHRHGRTGRGVSGFHRNRAGGRSGFELRAAAEGQPAALLAAGVACAVVAVILDGKAYGSLASAGRSVSKKSIVTCIVSGVLMGLWAPFVTRAMTHGNPLGPYSVAVFLTLGALLSCFDLECLFHEEAAGRRAGEFQRILQRAAFRPRARPARRIHLGHGHGLQSGGCQLYRSGDFLRHRPIRSHGRGSVGRAGLERVRGSGSQAKMYLVFMFVFYALAILLVAQANG